MAQRPKNFKITSVDVAEGSRVANVRISPTAAVPAMFTALLRLEAPDIDVEVHVAAVNGNPPTVQKLTVWTRSGASLTSGTLRQVLLDPILRAAIAAASRPVRTAHSDILPGAYHVEGDPEHQVWVDTPTSATERVRQIARLYRDAVTAGSRSPGLDAANAVHISRAQAARYIKKARELGLLPPQEEILKAPAPAPGPHDPHVDPVADPSVKPEPGPSIFRDPNTPWPWER